MQLTQEQRAYQVRVNRAHGVRPCQELEGTAERRAYCVWWARTLDAREARRTALTRERQARQDAALLPEPKSYVPRKRTGSVVLAMGTDAYTATVLLDRRVGVKVDPSTRRSIKGGKVGYEAVVTRANGAHLHGKPVCKGQVLCVPLSMLDNPAAVAEATPAAPRAKRNAAKRRAKATAKAVAPKRVAAPVKPKVAEVREVRRSRADVERDIVTSELGHNNVASK